MSESVPYHHDFTRLDNYLSHDYDPIEIANKLRDARLGLAELMAKEEVGP